MITTKAALTAFVTLVIMKSGVESTDTSIVSAFQCIDQQISNGVYTTSITGIYSYAITQTKN